MSDTEWPRGTGPLRAVFDSLGAGMFVTDTRGRITASNPFAQRILGWPKERLLGFDLHDLLHRRSDGSEIPRGECRSLAVVETGQPAEGSDEFYLRGDGTLMPIIWATTPVQHEGRVEGLVIVFHNFKAHHDAVEQTAAHLAALEVLTTRLSMVAEVSALLISTLDTSKMLNKLVRLLVPEMGDWAVVDLAPTEPAEGTRRVAVHAGDDPGAAEALKGPLPPLPHNSHTALARAMYGAQSVLLDERYLAQKPLSKALRQLLNRLGGHSLAVVPLHTRRQVFGVLTVARTGRQPAYTDAELLLLNDIARRAGLAMESNQLFAHQRHFAETMQRQLLPPLPQVGRFRCAARYRPAQLAAEIGGDWYDAFLLPDGAMAMVIGDVVGHDLQAAAHMAELRNMLRALAWDRREPAGLIMRRLDEVMANTSDAPMATSIFARIEGPEGGPWHLRWVNAGHPPPLLVTADGRTRYLEDGSGPLLGMSAALQLGLEWPDARAELPPRSSLLFYTDGLVESRGHPLDVGLANLRRHAAELAGHDIEDFLDAILARIDPSGDDVALLALRVPPALDAERHHPSQDCQRPPFPDASDGRDRVGDLGEGAVQERTRDGGRGAT